MSQSPAPFDQGLFLMHLHKGKEFFDQDQLQKAREELEAAYHLRPHDEKVLNMLGMTYYKLEMLPQAEEMYVMLAATNPDIYALQSNLGLIQLKLNKLEQARESLNRALELQPTNSKAHFYMGLLYEKQEMWEDALYHFEQANADKMVTKMQAKMDEERNKPELVLPFQVVEVLRSDADIETSVSSVIQEQRQPKVESEITGRMRAQDLAEAMFQIHDEEIPQVTEPSSETEKLPAETPITVHLPPVFEQPQEAEQTSEEEELIEDEGADSMAEKMKEEIQDEASWEKEHPSFFPEHFGEAESITHAESNLLIGPAVDEPFLLSDDIAADISTFLAESRTEESPEEDVFYREPVLPELTIVRPSEQAELGIPYPAESDENRIPTPEEVENEIGQETVSPEPPDIAEVPVILEEAEPVPGLTVEDAVEELSEEALLEAVSGTEDEEPREETAEAEGDLEVNFAVTESDEDGQIQQGFLQPSPLTPDFEEETLEQTQDMAYTIETPVESLEPAPQQEPPSIESTQDTEKELMQTSSPQPSPVQEETATLETPAIQETVREPAPEEVVHPANLDQFARDRLYIQPLIGSDRFLLIDPHLLEIIISEKLTCRIGTISSYTGNLQFIPLDKEKQEQVPLIHVSGTGILFLADRGKEIFLISLNNEVIFVESHHLLVAQSSLKIEPQVFGQQNTGASFSVVKISGRGTLALTCQTKPLTVNVHEGLPANIPAQAVIAWSGKVVSEVMDDEDLRKVMMSSDEESMFLRFRGTGDVVVEQGGLWGDRHTKRP